MDRTSIIASGAAAVAGIVVAVALALVSGNVVGHSTPSSDVSNVKASDGYHGSPDYGARDSSGAAK